MSIRAVQSLVFCAGSAVLSLVLQPQGIFFTDAYIFISAMAIIWALSPHKVRE